MVMNGKEPKDVYNIVDSPDGKSRWVRIGSAFLNRDGSINAVLDTFPSEGKIHIRDRKRPSSNGGCAHPQKEKGATR
jgi:hypothetical protein